MTEEEEKLINTENQQVQQAAKHERSKSCMHGWHRLIHTLRGVSEPALQETHQRTLVASMHTSCGPIDPARGTYHTFTPTKISSERRMRIRR
jgi:hypothetical protein